MSPSRSPIIRTAGPGDPGPTAGRGTMGLLVILGTILLGTCLYWNVIAFGGPLDVTPGWVRDLSLPASLVVERLAGPTAVPGAGQSLRVRRTVAGWAVASAAWFAAVWLVLAGPARSGGRRVIELIVGFSVIFRIVLIFSPPLLETDTARYLWDGATLGSGMSPYRYPPLAVLAYREGLMSPASAEERRELDALERLSRDPRIEGQVPWINHPGIATIYPPLAQAVFALAHRIAPGEVLVIKSLVALVDLAILAMIGSLLARLQRPGSWILIYGWCPLVLKEYAGTGHYDPVATAMALAAVLALLGERRILAGVLLGLGTGAKLFPMVLAAILHRRLGRAGLIATLVTICLIHIPIGRDLPRWGESLRIFGTKWVGNSSIFVLSRATIEAVAPPHPAAARPTAAFAPDPADSVGRSDALARGALALVLGLALLRLSSWPDAAPAELVTKVFATLAILFILSPVQNPWYLGWILPFASLISPLPWVVLAGTQVTYYAYFSGPGYLRSLPGLPGHAIDLRWLEYLPFFALLLATSSWKFAFHPKEL